MFAISSTVLQLTLTRYALIIPRLTNSFQSVRGCIESTKNFTRWMAGTCIEVPPQGEREDEAVVFSYHSDIQNVTAITDMSMIVSQTITKSLGA